MTRDHAPLKLMQIFPSMTAAREHYAYRGFNHQKTHSDGRVTLLHPAHRSRVHLAPTADGRVRSLWVLGCAVNRGPLRVHCPGTVPDARRSRLWPLGLLVALPFIAMFAAYGLVLALVLVGCDQLPGFQRGA